MRWSRTNPENTPHLFKGDKRRVRKFAWLPVTIDFETRWLERYDVEQVIVTDYYARPLWANVCFIDNVGLWDYSHQHWTSITGRDRSGQVYDAVRHSTISKERS